MSTPRKTIILAASALSLLGTAAAFAQAGAPGHRPTGDISRTALVQKLDERFAKLDANRDGVVTRDEMKAARAQMHDARFTRLDTDRNGAISRAEFDAPQGHDGGHRWHRGHGGGMRGLMKDGQVTKAAFEGRALARFDRMDADHNGVVTAAERHAAWSAMKAHRAQPAA